MADVVLAYLRVFPSFERSSYECANLLEIVERRWSYLEQPLHLLAFFLDPRYHHIAIKSFDPIAILQPGTLADCAVQ